MPGTMDKTEIATEIRKAATKHGIWALCFEQTWKGGNSRVWWFKRSGEDCFIQRDITDREALEWLRDIEWDILRDLRLDDRWGC